jgi:hypothetical protein
MFIVLMMFSSVFGENSIGQKPLKKTAVVEDMWMDANRMSGVFRNNGVWYYDYATGDWGLEWPKGSGLSPIFGAGQWISAKVGDEVKVAAVIHSASEFQAGEILSPGQAANPRDDIYQWYVIEPDGVGDWDTWPVEQGAPVDENGDPLLLGDMTAFSVWNDLGEHSLFGTNKLGAEVRQLVFAFNRADAMGDMTFIKWQIINKSDADWDSTYLSIWCDPDIGDGWDDFVGSDPGLGLGYCYNANNDDQNYGAAPPAVGIDFFQGPIIDEPGSVVVLPDGTELQDKKMLKMTAFIYYNNDDSNQGNPQTSGDVWNYQRGFWRDNSLISDPNGNPSAFMFSGDPETNTGWIDSDDSDRRFLMTTGPFTMPKWEDTNSNGIADFGEPGVQEIVAGVILGRGANNLNSVTFLKAVDNVAQQAYDNNFALPRPPIAPEVEVVSLPNEIILKWDDRSEFLSDGITPYFATDIVADGLVGQNLVVGDEYKVVDDGTFDFAKYSIYQYSDASGRDPVLVPALEPRYEYGVQTLKESTPYLGKRFIRISQNKNPVVGNVGEPLYNGKTYYFGVQADSYLEFSKPDQYLSSPPTIVSVAPQYSPGERLHSAYDDTIGEVSHTILDPSLTPADLEVAVRIVDPTQVTGHDYEIYFNSQQYFRDENGEWHEVVSNAKSKSLSKTPDVSPSTLTGAAIYSDVVGTIDLNYALDLVSPTDAWVDGVLLTLPSGVTINSAESVHSYDDVIEPVIDHAANTVMWGRSDTTQGGDHSFVGGEIFSVNVNTFELPLVAEYVIYDDGWNADGHPINAVGKDTITTVGYEYRTENHWNLKDVTIGQEVLEDRLDIFDLLDEGASAPVVDGLQVTVKGLYDLPWDFTPPAHPPIDGTGTYEIDSYGYNDWSEYGPTYSSRAIHTFGAGTEDLNMLLEDYELRFTGEYVDPDADVVYVREGTGSVATLYDARLFDIADHPMNPNPGTDDPFTVRIPFEVWNVTLNKQVNLMVYDRMQSPETTSQWYAFNPADRMYCYILNTDYSEEVHDPDGAEMDSLTWNLVFWEADWALGDVIHINYPNPINLGMDKVTFSTKGYETMVTREIQVSDIEKINVVPNPYYGYHSGEMDPFSRWVQFTYLPERCTIRIFDLTGTLVRKLEKDDPATPFLQWDLENEFELPVASGVYVYHVDVPGAGKKVGKMAIFAPNERLDTY